MAAARAVTETREQTRAAARHGEQAVRDTVAGMAEIETVVVQAAGKVGELGDLGEKIGAVVNTIDDIAEQTNLLALNAAIEAARAGEHGRGFAVVAEQMRKLAERSQRETRAIADLIREVQRGARSVVDGVRSISEVAERNQAATEAMTARATRVNDATAAIAAVAEENSASTEEVSAAAETGARVEAISARARDLARTAEGLERLVVRFRLATEMERAAPLRRAA
jgi:methyl-accepting chemotaxis protein